LTLDSIGSLINLIAIPVVWVILQPLKPALAALESSINNLAQEIVGLRQQASDNRAEIAGIKESVKDAHHRISRLEDRVKELEGKCRNCTCKG
jgi:chromosome segregation ATPase